MLVLPFKSQKSRQKNEASAILKSHAAEILYAHPSFIPPPHPQKGGLEKHHHIFYTNPTMQKGAVSETSESFKGFIHELSSVNLCVLHLDSVVLVISVVSVVFCLQSSSQDLVMWFAPWIPMVFVISSVAVLSANPALRREKNR